MVVLGIASERYVSVQNFRNETTRVRSRATIRREAVGALGQFVLNVVADQRSELQIAFSRDFRKVVFPNKQVFVILPWCLVPKCRIPIRTPVRGQAYARRFGKHSGKL